MNAETHPDPNPEPPATVAEELGFLAAIDAPVPYMQRLRDWKLAVGGGTPYVWAHFGDVPFSALRKPLTASSIALITTAAHYQPDKGDQGPGSRYNAQAKFFEVYASPTSNDPDLRVSHVGIDRKHTSMEDPRCWFPLDALRAAASAGRVGRVAPRFFGVPTVRDPRTTIWIHAGEVLRLCMEDQVDAAILIPNCTICHQTLSLVARMLEQSGIPTVIMACAKDIVEHVGVPRALFSDFPLGNGAGRPGDVESQIETLGRALDLLESARAPRTTVQSPLRWSDDPRWKSDFSNVENIPADQRLHVQAASR
ncbi:glycine/sarcosine/betaine reductase selenoprotein B family protein [Pseudorhodoferax soli]|uniref:Glycine/betaine/sarcosine/D-proline reductase family selenoprotein B n=1 Tax=Pseudorhodoferax soli TaxID=545864 RepID=A0A368XB38_9BURK|nr:glycine/sarcosine/betaine reductase selenoprotein B family protein [Pseudorhodoferax soli]RCW63234.1 glycine/betaine/sarcosine/D-proline reductase family selenoprotein B [Pseudorhodoferax soli]